MSAKQCREHRWLAKKSARQVERMIPGPEVRSRNDAEDRSRSLAQTDPSRSLERQIEELDVTKDNLRLFVERWREHPDSPYLLDIPQHLLAPRQQARNRDETTSLRCHSPSPCESLCSTPSEPNDSPKDNRGSSYLRVPSYNLALERRASEGMDKSRDPASQIVLAEEIIRLSEHLRSIAMSPRVSTSNEEGSRVSDSNSSLSDNNSDNRGSKTGSGTGGGRNGVRNTGRSIVVENSECNEIAQKLSSITRQRKLNGTTFFGTRSFEKQTETSVPVFPTLKKTRRSEVESDGKVFRSQETSTEGNVFESFKEKSEEARRLFDSCLEEVEMDLTPPWRRPRVKHSFGETSRDVPRISTLRDLHKNLNLDEPSDTKDLLLHLIGEWEDSAAARIPGAGRKSISVDWYSEESIARKSLNSLAEYFQSKQRNTGLSDASTPTSPSIHR